jgi:hypothetical protein
MHRFAVLLCLPLVAALFLWASCSVLSSIDLSVDEPWVEEASAIVEAFCRRDDELQAEQRKASGPEAARIAEQRRSLREKMVEDVAEVCRRHNREWRQPR